MTPILTQHSVVNVVLPLSEAALLYRLLGVLSQRDYEDKQFTLAEGLLLSSLYHRTKEQLQKLSA